MNYGAILAGGTGSRINSLNYPKQFYVIKGKPIIIYTIEKMVYSDSIDLVYVAVNREYLDKTKELVKKYNLIDHVVLIEGGKTRLDTIDNIINVIIKTRDVGDEDIILIHDAVRPFVTNKIINSSIEMAKKYGASVATIPATDTIVASSEKKSVDYIPNRNELFCGQSPDTFRLQEFIKMEQNLTEEQKSLVTGTSQICTFNNKKIYMVEGDPINFKITTDLDLLLAEKIIMEDYYEKNN